MNPRHADGLGRAVGEAHRRYTNFINARGRWTGHLFQSRFASVAMDESHLISAVCCVSLNPVRARHAGPREPVEDGEPSEGLWLRLVNNSAIAIEVETMDTATKSKLMLLPDVITPIERSIPRSGSNREEMPAGYASGMGVLRTIAPGKDIAFSVPANHVSPNWFMQIPFHFSLPSVSQGDQTICLVKFSWTMIPESDRANLSPHRP